MDYTFLDIAQRADTPPEVLGRLLSVARSADARLAALKNPRVDRSAKIAYEETLCPTPTTGSHYGEEFQIAGMDADAPLQLLQCFAAEPGNRFFVAMNPSAPINLLERLTRPDIDETTRKAAQENIQKRGIAKP